MVLKEVEASLERLNIGRSEPVTVGLSGGADSVCLLHCLYKLGQNVTAVHVHHMIRGEEADHDAQFARDLCAKLDIPFFLEYADVPTYAAKEKLTLEQAARILRYDILYRHTEGFLAVAHNLNDQAETVLLRLVRGTGADGIVAMKERSGKLIRPLLRVSRGDIEEYCSQNHLEFVTDSTNLEQAYSRNTVRLQVLPALERVNPTAVRSIVRASELIGEDADFIRKSLEGELWRITADGNAAYLDITDIEAVHIAISSRLVREAIARIDSPVDIERAHVNACLELVKGQSGRSVSLPRGLTALYSGSFLVISRGGAQSQTSVEFTQGASVLDGARITVSAVDGMGERKANCEYIALDDIKDVVFRHRREGDVIRPLGASGSKSLKKYLIDKKIPLHKRDELVLVAKDSEILAVVGLTVADSVAVGKDNTKKVYKIVVE